MKIYFINKKTLASTLFACLMVTGLPLFADDVVTESQYNEINNRVNSMNYRELVDARTSLNNELTVLEDRLESTQSPASNKSIKSRIKLIKAELSSIQRF